MKKAIILFPTLFLVLLINAQTTTNLTVNKATHKGDVVINYKMIEKFNHAEYSADQLSFNDILSKYNFESIKLISLAYQNGEIEKPTIKTIDSYLASVKSNPEYNKPLEPSSEMKDLVTNIGNY